MKDKNELKKKFGPKAIGQVVRILNDSFLIIDVGRSSVDDGDIVQVYESLGSLIGPDGTDLGPLEYIKATLEVVQREEQYSVCKAIRSSTPPALNPLLEGPFRASFDVATGEIEPLNPSDKRVRVGNPVKRA